MLILIVRGGGESVTFARLSSPLSSLWFYFLIKTTFQVLFCGALSPVSLIGKLHFSVIVTAFSSPFLSDFLCTDTYSSFLGISFR